MQNPLASRDILPTEPGSGVFVGRIRQDGPDHAPRPVVLRGQDLVDLSGLAPTLSDLFERAAPARAAGAHDGKRLCSLDRALLETRLLAPCDFQAIKACGVTFTQSLLERLAEEQAQGGATEAGRRRAALERRIGTALAGVRPGSPESRALKEAMLAEGSWSQYLEVGFGPDPEVFTKAQPLSAVGCGASLALHPGSRWCVSEPEIVLAVNSRREVVGASLGNDLTLRDFEGRSALLLGQAKDFNASCAIGPFVRLFDADFGMDRVRQAGVELRVEGDDGFVEHGTNDMSRISRDPESLVAAAAGGHHWYPDGLMLFLGTMYVPYGDRDGPGSGFTHKAGDRVSIHSPALGTLVNPLEDAGSVPPWTLGARALARALCREHST